MGWFGKKKGDDDPKKAKHLVPIDDVPAAPPAPAAPAAAPSEPRKLLFDWSYIDPDAPATTDYGDNQNFHVLPAPRHYNANTVGALFRLHPIPAGFIATWRQVVVAHDLDGRERWRVPGFAKYLAVSPDGTRVAMTREGAPQILIADARSGPSFVFQHGTYLWDLAWSADGQRVAVIADQALVIFDVARREAVKRFTDFPKPEHLVLKSIVALPDGRFAIAHPNGKCIVVLDEHSGAMQVIDEPYANLLFMSPSGQRLWTANTWVAASLVVSPSAAVASLEVPGSAGAQAGPAAQSSDAPAPPAHGFEQGPWFKMPGKLGVRAIGQRDDFSYTQFEPIPRASHDDKVLLVNDRTGQLWLMSAVSGKAFYRWPREVVDQVEDTLWVGGADFLVATNDRRIRRLSFFSHTPTLDIAD